LDPTPSVRWEAVSRLGSASGALCVRIGLYEGCGDPIVEVGNGRDGEALQLLLLSLLKGAVFKVPLEYEFFYVGGSRVVFNAAGCAPREYEANAGILSACIAAPKRLYSGDNLTFEISFPFVRSPLARGWEMESDYGLCCQLFPSGGVGYAGQCTRYGLLACGPV
jgi:hypothetical protein